MRVPLIDGQGNFGSMDPDPPAAMRYTEARLARVGDDACSTISTRTLSTSRPITTRREREPQVLPARFPNLLVNGAGGIAVGMATNIPPHNLGEVIAACKAYMDDPAITVEELMEHRPGAGFPDRRPLILGQAGARSAYQTGRGSIIMRSRHEIEEGRGDRRSIVLTAIPYQVGKTGLVEKIAEAAKDKRIEGVSDIRDESNRDGVRVVIELKRDATPDVVLNQLWRHTPGADRASRPTCSRSAAAGPRRSTCATSSRRSSSFREEVITRALEVRARQGARPRPSSCSAWSSRSPISTRWCGSSAAPRRPPRRAPPCSPANGRSREIALLHRARRSGRARGRRATPTACPTRRSARSSSCASTA